MIRGLVIGAALAVLGFLLLPRGRRTQGLVAIRMNGHKRAGKRAGRA